MEFDFIQYYADCKYIKMEHDLCFKIFNSAVIGIEISFKEEKACDIKECPQIDNLRSYFIVRCYFQKINDPKEAYLEAKQKIEELLGKISFVHENAIISEPFFSYAHVNDELITFTDLFGSLEVRRSLDFEKIDCVNNDKIKLDHLFLFRAAHKEDNEIARFILLYSLLHQIINEKCPKKHSQLVNDQIIYLWEKENGKQTEWRRSTKPDKQEPETIYTWLRNGISHATGDLYVNNNIHMEVRRALGDLLNLVKKAMLSYHELTKKKFGLAKHNFNINQKQILDSISNQAP